MSGKTILAVLAVLAAGCFGAETSSAQPGCSDENCVRVGSFNIQLLGNGGPGSGHIDAIAKLIADEAKLDLAVLEEININSADWSNLKAASKPVDTTPSWQVHREANSNSMWCSSIEPSGSPCSMSQANSKPGFRRQNPAILRAPTTACANR